MTIGDIDSVEYAAIDTIAHEYLAAGNVGLVVATIAGDERRVAGYGRCGQETDKQPDEKTMFEIGSITKVFTACLLADMAAAGEVNLTDPVQKFLPESVRVPVYDGQEITLQHLATHTSSLPRLPDNLDATVQDESNPYANYTIEDLYAFLSRCQLRRPIGSRVEYSNLGMGLLGHVLALKAGKSFEELIRTRIREPLGLNETTITLTPEQLERLAPGHTADGKPTSNWDAPTLAGAGALRSTGADMLAFLAACMGHGNCAARRALRRTQLPRFGSVRLALMSWGLALALLLSLASVSFQWTASLRPGGVAFGIAVLAPICFSAWYGGLIAGLLATLLTVGGTYSLWKESFGWQPLIAFGPLISWYLSRRHRSSSTGLMLGWQYQSLHAVWHSPRMTWHNGGTGGYASFLGFVKERETGVVVLSNSANSVDDIAVEILRVLSRDR